MYASDETQTVDVDSFVGRCFVGVQTGAPGKFRATVRCCCMYRTSAKHEHILCTSSIWLRQSVVYFLLEAFHQPCNVKVRGVTVPVSSYNCLRARVCLTQSLSVISCR